MADVDAFHVKGIDGVIRGLDEHYDDMNDVRQDPYGAWLAIQNQHAEIERLRAANASALERLKASRFANAEHAQAITILKNAQREADQ